MVLIFPGESRVCGGYSVAASCGATPMTIVPVFLTMYMQFGSSMEISTKEYAPSKMFTHFYIDSLSEKPWSRKTPIQMATISVSV